MNDLELLDKARAIYNSCETQDHFAVAGKWLGLAMKQSSRDFVKLEMVDMQYRANIEKFAIRISNVSKLVGSHSMAGWPQ